MKAWAVCDCGEPLQQIERPTPQPEGSEVVVEVSHCGVCHSDLHVWQGYYDLGGGKRLDMVERGLQLPVVLGHEVVGRVVAVGPDAKDVTVGDERIVYPWVGCGHCDVCVSGQDNLCENPASIGIYQFGGYGTHVKVPHPRYLVDFGTLDPALAATYACSGLTVYAAVQKILPLPADTAVVLIGAGGLGLTGVGMLRALGQRNIVVADVSDEKRTGALKAGATAVVDSGGEGAVKVVREACGGGALAIIDFVNSTATASLAMSSLRKGGRLVQVGLFGGELTLSLPIMAIQQRSICGSFTGTLDDLRAVVALAQSGKLTPIPIELVAHSDANVALERLHTGKVEGRLVLRAEAVDA